MVDAHICTYTYSVMKCHRMAEHRIHSYVSDGAAQLSFDFHAAGSGSILQ